MKQRAPASSAGHLLHYGRELNSMHQVIGIMLVIIVIGLAADKGPVLPLGALPAPTVGHRGGGNERGGVESPLDISS